MQLRFRLADRLLRRGHVDMAPQDDAPRTSGLTVIKPATKVLAGPTCRPTGGTTLKSSRASVSRSASMRSPDDDLDPFEALASSRKIIPLDDSHKAQIEALQQSGYTTLWIADHHLLQTHTCALKELMDGEGKELGLVGVFETNSAGPEPRQPQLLPLSPDRTVAGGSSASRPAWPRPTPGAKTARGGPPATSTACRTWRPSPRPTAASKTRTRPATRSRRPTTPCRSPRSWARTTSTVDPMFEDRKTTLKPHKDGRLVMEIERKKGDAELNGARTAGSPRRPSGSASSRPSSPTRRTTISG